MNSRARAAWMAMLLAGAAGATPLAPIDGKAYTGAQQLVPIAHGRKLNLYCVGQGGPTVIFDAGLTDPLNVWAYVQAAIAGRMRACSYDRAGVGYSDPGVRPATSVNMVDDLHQLLTAAAIAPPYLLVAHSSGALNARLYAYYYPQEVAGMVLVDPTVENQTDAFRRLAAPKSTAEQWDALTIEPGLTMRRNCIRAAEVGIVPGSARADECGFPQYPQLSGAVQEATIRFQLQPAFQRAQLAEEEQVFRYSAEQVRAAHASYGNLPLEVLSRSPWPPPKNATPERLALSHARYALWLQLHRSVAALSARGTHTVVVDAGHAIQLEQPQAVIDAILRVRAGIGPDLDK